MDLPASTLDLSKIRFVYSGGGYFRPIPFPIMQSFFIKADLAEASLEFLCDILHDFDVVNNLAAITCTIGSISSLTKHMLGRVS